MASATIDQKIIRKTQDTLGKVIKKPPLTEKHLSKPPFRYLHDMLMEISRVTSFFKGLYSGKELDGRREWSREDKITFFQKAIDVVGFTTGKIPKVRPSKIIAGAEAEKTNELLQLIGMAILKKIDSTEAVQKVLKGEKPTLHSDKKGTREEVEVKEKKNTVDMQKKSADEEKENESVTNSNPDPLPDPIAYQERPQHRPGTRRKTRESQGGGNTEKDSDPLSSEGSGSQMPFTDRPPSAKGERKTLNKDHPLGISDETNSRDQDSDHSPSPTTIAQNGLVPLPTRPSSSRPPAPRIIKKIVDSEEPTSRTNSGQERKQPTVILDVKERQDDDDNDEEEEEYLVEDSMALTSPSEAFSESQSKPEGALTKTLMAAKERFGGDEKKAVSRSVTISEAQRKREREIVQREVLKLQSSIQSLSQTANPLGKIMDYVQEDLDSMEKELETWKKENTQHTDALRREEKITEDELTPLKAQLTELNANIDEQYDLISASKATVLLNDQRIQQMLLSMN